MQWTHPDGSRGASGTFASIPASGPSPRPRDRPAVAGRYEVLDLLGWGGMGEVWRVRDRELERDVAMKLLLAPLVDADGLARFREEARIAASLQHPGVVPVYDVGRLDDGRVWFTMAEVRGQTLEQALQQVHRDVRLAAEGTSPRRLLEAFVRVCETVAFAHDRGVVHRDLKPANVMIGEYGEVLVLDWGLARLQARAHRGGQRIVGTPAYMSPEQARGDSERAAPTSDVYALGASLYDLLCERPPRLERTVDALLAQVSAGSPIPPPSARSPLALVDDALDAVCLRALAHDPAERHPSAGDLARALAAWLDGAAKRAAAMTLVTEAQSLLETAHDADADAVRAEAEADALLHGVPANAPAEAKLAAWRAEDAARDAERRAVRARTQAVQQLRSALTHAPDLAEAHELLAGELHRRHVEHEAAARSQLAAEVAAELATHDPSGAYAAYLRGTGAVTLVTDPPGAEVRLHRLEERERRLVPTFERTLGHTPLQAVPVAMGDYLLTLHLPDRPEVRYPVQIPRQHHWDGVAPGASDPTPIALPPADALAADERYVPAGWAWLGSDALPDALPWARRWVDAVVVQQFPVTLADYAAYLDALAPDALQAALPRLPDSDEPFLVRDDGRYTVTAAGRWREVLPDTLELPAVLVDHGQAAAYAAWRGRRLPTEAEWQKAARGVDGRDYPWGRHFEPSWCRMRETAPTVSIVSVREHPEDRSIYGVRGLLGNTFEWAASGRPGEGARFLGGCCGSTRVTCHLAWSLPASPATRTPTLGFRLVRSL
ncbi:MAG: SUMF1/EgtB/PvdO family nonheme iron enzyme [Myxococcota bacterium]